MKLAALLLFVSACCFAATPSVTFIKEFPGSTPAYECISVTRDGAVTYVEAPNDPMPVKAQLQQADTDALFAAADKLDHFKGQLESGLKVANTGKKTLRYVDESGKQTQAVFNYSQDLNAQQLWDRFEQIAASERAYLDLDRTVHFDKLGVNDALAEIEALWLRKELAAPTQFIPLLTRVATHETFMHMARERSARLKDEFAAVTVTPQQ